MELDTETCSNVSVFKDNVVIACNKPIPTKKISIQLSKAIICKLKVFVVGKFLLLLLRYSNINYKL